MSALDTMDSQNRDENGKSSMATILETNKVKKVVATVGNVEPKSQQDPTSSSTPSIPLGKVSSKEDKAVPSPDNDDHSKGVKDTTPRTALTALAPKAEPLMPDLRSTPSRSPARTSHPSQSEAHTARNPSPPTEIHTKTTQVKTNFANQTLPGGQITTKSSSPKNVTTLRRGKWTVEEEAYVARVIQDFNSGFLNAAAGTTLRSYLSEKLQCDPMRITKKFTGDACIGKRVFHPAVRSGANTVAIDKAQAELDALERRWRRRLEMQQRESAKKAAASAAVASVAPNSGRMIQGVPVAALSRNVSQEASDQRIGQNVVTQAASWLDRANAILKGTKLEMFPVDSVSQNAVEESLESIDVPSVEIENQMKEVERLIYEGPLIQQTAAGLPSLLVPNQGPRGDSMDPPTPPEPADKRMRIGSNVSGAEDAEALVGFLRSVRASAAAGNEA